MGVWKEVGFLGSSAEKERQDGKSCQIRRKITGYSVKFQFQINDK